MILHLANLSKSSCFLISSNLNGDAGGVVVHRKLSEDVLLAYPGPHKNQNLKLLNNGRGKRERCKSKK